MESVSRKPYARNFELERVTLRELIDRALRNCVDSYHILEITSENIPQAGLQRMTSRPSHETYASNVLELAVHIPDSWKNDKIRQAEARVEKAWPKVLFLARTLHHAIIELLIERKDLEAVKLPRTLID